MSETLLGYIACSCGHVLHDGVMCPVSMCFCATCTPVRYWSTNGTEPLSSAYCKQHDIYLCEVCTIKKLKERLAEYKAENAALREELEQMKQLVSKWTKEYGKLELHIQELESSLASTQTHAEEFRLLFKDEYSKHVTTRQELADTRREIAVKEEELKIACREITRLENSDDLRRQNVELQKAVNALNSFDAPAELVKAREELKVLDTKYVKALEAVNDYMYKWGFSLKKVEYLEQREKQLREALNDIQMHVREADFSWESWVYDRAEAALAEGESK